MTSVSVVMTAWNAAQHIAEAIGSARQQTAPATEIVVVDDGSTDRTAAIAEGLGATVLRRAHEGIGPSRNAGIAASRGEVVAFLDADDLWLPRKLELQVAVLDEDPAVEAVSSLVDEFVEGTPGGVRQPMLGVAGALASNTIVRRATIDRVGDFDSSMVIADWVRWWARARRNGVVERTVPEVLLRRRIHSGNNSARVRDGGTRFLAIAREHRRAQREGA